MKRAAYLLLAVVCVLSVSCGKGNFSERASQGKANTFVYPIVTNPTTLDPQIVKDGDTIDLIQNIYEGLVGWGEDNKPVGTGAESWDVSKDGLTYTFHLRHGVKFQNGREVTAADYKWSFERACNPKLASSTTANYLDDIVGALERRNGTAKDVPGVIVNANDPYTVTLKIKSPKMYFLEKLTYPVYFPVPKELVSFDKEISDKTQAVGTGPYKVETYEPNQVVVLDAFKDYWGGAPKIDKIERPVITDAQTRLSKFKSGEIDLVPLERQDVPALQKDETLSKQLHFFPRPALWYIGMNNANPPFDKKEVRQAIAESIDKDHIVKDLLAGINDRADNIVPSIGFDGWPRAQAKGLPYDPEGAKKLLAQAGYPGGQGLPTMTINYRLDRPDIEIVATEVANELHKNLGMNVKLQALEWRHYLELNDHNQLAFFHMRWAADYLDPQNFLSLLLASYGNENHVGYKNAQFDALCKKADSSINPEERKQLYAQAEDIVLQDAPFVPIYFQKDAELINPRVSGLRESLFGHLPHTTVTLGK
jgi:oligopeptide transport system substrate-binding protein